MSSIGVFIPARLNSSRLKEKMLIEFDGRPLIKSVYDKVKKFGYDTYVVTDSNKIASLFSSNCIMTDSFENGTARIASIIDKYKYSSYINLQGDLVDVTKDLVDKIAAELPYEDVVTAYTKNKSSVRVIHDSTNAYWFTRKDLGYGDYHIGIYGYSYNALDWYRSMEQTEPELKEDLEQLRFMSAFDVALVEHDYKGREINTVDDL